MKAELSLPRAPQIKFDLLRRLRTLGRLSRGQTRFQALSLTLAGVGTAGVAASTLAASQGLIGLVLVGAGLTMTCFTYMTRYVGLALGIALTGLSTLGLGAVLLMYPSMSAIALTAAIALLFTAQAVSAVSLGLELRREAGWGWLITSALVSIVAALIAAMSFETLSYTLLSVVVGVNFAFTGLCAFLFQARRIEVAQ